MKRSKRMRPIVHVAENREQEAARRLGEARGELSRREQQLEELRQYRDEYTQRFESQGGGGVDMGALLSFRQFLGQLNVAIEQQEGVVERAREVVRQRIEEWQQTRSRLQAMEKTVERLRDEETELEERREQGETDERAQRYRGPR